MHHKNPYQIYNRIRRTLERATKLMEEQQDRASDYALGLANMAEIILDELGPIMEDPHAQDGVESFPTWRRE